MWPLALTYGVWRCSGKSQMRQTLGGSEVRNILKAQCGTLSVQLITVQCDGQGDALRPHCAGNRRLLRQRGYTVRKMSNCWIATFYLLHGHRWLHRDQDFYPFEKVLGLQVVKALRRNNDGPAKRGAIETSVVQGTLSTSVSADDALGVKVTLRRYLCVLSPNETSPPQTWRRDSNPHLRL